MIQIYGIYKHFKGDFYRVIAVGKNESTKEEAVVYRGCRFGDVWVRPMREFVEQVMCPDGELRPRFELMQSGTAKKEA